MDGERRGGWIYYRLLEQPPERARTRAAVRDGLPHEDAEARLQASQVGVSCL